MKKPALAVGLLVLLLGVGFLIHTAGPGRSKSLPSTAPQAQGRSVAGPESARQAPSRQVYRDPSRDAGESPASADIEKLKQKMKAGGTNFTLMKRDLERKLAQAPDGKLDPGEIMSVIPPEHRDEFKIIMKNMHTQETKPMTMKEKRP